MVYAFPMFITDHSLLVAQFPQFILFASVRDLGATLDNTLSLPAQSIPIQLLSFTPATCDPTLCFHAHILVHGPY